MCTYVCMILLALCPLLLNCSKKYPNVYINFRLFFSHTLHPGHSFSSLHPSQSFPTSSISQIHSSSVPLRKKKEQFS